MIVLIDTNILLDVLQQRRAHYDDAARVWTLVEQKVFLGYVSAISFNNVFYILRKQIGAAQALAAVKSIRAVFGAVPLDEQVIDHAVAITTTDFEDAIQAAAAMRIRADHVITRNVADFRSLAISAITPQEGLALFKP